MVQGRFFRVAEGTFGFSKQVRGWPAWKCPSAPLWPHMQAPQPSLILPGSPLACLEMRRVCEVSLTSRHVNPPAGSALQRRNMYVAMFPKQGEPSHDKTLLLWAYDDVAACRRAPDGDDDGDDEHATRGVVELVTPSAEMEAEGKKKGKGKSDDRKYLLRVLSAKAGKKGGKGKLVEVWSAYAENKETATDWYHVLAEEEDDDDDDDDEDDDEDD